MVLYFLKYDGDEVPSHPWTIVEVTQQDEKLTITNAVQMSTLESAVHFLQALQQGDLTIEAVTVG